MDDSSVLAAIRKTLDVLDRPPALQVIDQLDQGLLALVAHHVVAEVKGLVGHEGDVGTPHDHRHSGVADALRVPIGSYGGGGRSRYADQIGRQNVVPVDIVQALGVDVDFMTAGGHQRPKEREPKAHLFDEAVYVETWSGRFDERYSHARLSEYRWLAERMVTHPSLAARLAGVRQRLPAGRVNELP